MPLISYELRFITPLLVPPLCNTTCSRTSFHLFYFVEVKMGSNLAHGLLNKRYTFKPDIMLKVEKKIDDR
jgi:hypothetical protein